MIKFLTSVVVASAALAASPALAVDAFTVFNGTNGTGGFYYGSASGTALSDYNVTATGGCFLPGGTCLYSSASPDGVIPGVVKGGSYSTVDYDGTTLAMHPSNSLDTFAAFRATTAGKYAYTIKLKAIGTDSVNGVGVTDFTSVANVATLGSRQVLPGYTSATTLSGQVVLAAGQQFGAIVDANGNYGGDTTALTFGVTAVPEPAQWALMIGGFGFVGGAMRRRRATLVAA
ncbi:PEPxxWA-CTERM sorting domain-containing protein [Sphingomonas antarctica]|uniref:PEPxxWA-CTERM sorting domain-containing protein n=1 Tax=Sphingomonas antarctica TaxID=2040274 RepID=UPI0039E734D1